MTKLEEDLLKVKNYRQTWVIGFSLIGLALNLILSAIVVKTGISLYLDTVGTVLCAVFSGYLPGVVVGLLTNLIKGLSDTASLYYGVINVLIAVVARFLYQKGWLRTVPTTIVYIAALTAVGGGMGSVLPMCLEGFATQGIFNDLLIDFADKTVTVIICVLALHLVPDNIREKISFKTWYQNPISKEMAAEMRNIECRVVSIRTKIMALIIIVMLAVGAASISISYVLYRNATENDRIEWAEGMALAAAGIIDPEKVDSFIKLGFVADGYANAYVRFKNLLRSSSQIEYIYVYRLLEDGCHVVFDIDTADLEGESPGTVIPFDDAFKPYIGKLLAGEKIPPMISNGAYGWLLTVYCPVYDKAGNCVCYAAADVSMADIESNARAFFLQMVFLFAGFFILVLTICFWVTEYNIILPINAMALCTNLFAKHSKDDIKNGIKRMEDLGIVTGDEVENFYHSLCKMANDTADYIDDINEKTETIQKLQNAFIFVLADMVESRDKNTGAHVRKTVAYTREIMLSLREMGYYTDLLTDKFIEDVENSAPLHDVGKITVPDAVLNKPGKLDNDEFTIMKDHTVAGAEIINRVISQVPESDFLKDARDLAHFHHEKWDGSGYPTGISREEIPLAARIMAVADVFDALTSQRSYKPPFTYEKAMEIIEEGAGTHFDPLVVKAFRRVEDKVRIILSKNQNNT